MGGVKKAFKKVFGGGSQAAAAPVYIPPPPPPAVAAPTVQEPKTQQQSAETQGDTNRKTRRGKGSLIIPTTGINAGGGQGGLNI